MKNTMYVSLILALGVMSCKKEPHKIEVIDPPIIKFHLLNEAKWLLGNWENNSDEEGNLTEKWSVKNDSTYFAETYFIKGKDTLFSEKVDLMQRNNKLYYIPTVTNQNDNNGIEFTLTHSSPSELIFENPLHDYPKKITYKLINNDSLDAQISGNGKSEEFHFQRRN
jgi:hypothetical protein